MERTSLAIVADENIPRVEELFRGCGGLKLLPGRAIDAASLARADILLVRSVTRVNSDLLQQSPVRFVGSATSGTDHVDIEYLQRRGIGFRHAPGCNARSVAEYVLAALLALRQAGRRDLSGKRALVIGCGNAGSMTRTLLEAAGIECRAHDPPLAERTGNPEYLNVEAMQTADIISLHVPLSDSGPHPTRDMIDAGFLAGVRPDVVLINTARGEVIDDDALLEFLAACPGARVVLDVWRDEPRINPALLAKVSIGTPHIAGYSQDGRILATRMINAGLCEFFGLNTEVNLPLSKSDAGRELRIHVSGDYIAVMQAAVAAVYDILHDNHNLKKLLDRDPRDRAACFDDLRKNYRMRREFPSLRIDLATADPDPDLRRSLAGLGFQVALT
ncbi:MAG: 4-phosphoerythronate dehydrogenase [Gammaproteobacteria bacterium]|nr:MAG: 4-phosphoerythronate dehydrogenase [Gammaproteobacteria bacterium]